jgi:NTP pyrophosphatase (non-canonical NTP hydrolase)
MTTHFNGLSPAEAERLALLAEECGECIQVIGKILRHGYESKNPFNLEGPTNREMLEKELADMSIAAQMMQDARDFSEYSLIEHLERKRESIKKYLHHQGDV